MLGSRVGSIKIRIFFQINFRCLNRGALGHRCSKSKRIFQKYQFPSVGQWKPGRIVHSVLLLADCIKLATWLVNLKLKPFGRERIFLKNSFRFGTFGDPMHLFINVWSRVGPSSEYGPTTEYQIIWFLKILRILNSELFVF